MVRLRFTVQALARLGVLPLIACLALGGCHALSPVGAISCQATPPEFELVHVPRELDKVILPTYTIEPPDILWVEVTNAVPRAPYRLQALDVLRLAVQNTLPGHPIDGNFPIEPGGTVDLGSTYGRVHLTGKTLQEARTALAKYLQQHLREPHIQCSLAQVSSMEQLGGEHLVGPDGTITLGPYGRVGVVGMTIDQAREAVAEHLNQFLDHPRVSLSVFSYNSKRYYVIVQGAGLGDRVLRFPSVGNETVLDAISQIEGLTDVSSKKLWIARPGRNRVGGNQILPIDWLGITQRGEVETNYQILPGDRIYVAENKLVALDIWVAKATSPLERILNFTLLGTGTVSRLSGKVLENRAVQIQATSF